MTTTSVGRPQRTWIYVDGFNLYFRALRGTPYKWLDLLALFRSLLRPTNDITTIRYFTAMVSGRHDPATPIRQQTYLRALQQLPQVQVHLGNFLVSRRWAALADPPARLHRPSPVTAYIVKTEEKGSDVNLATWLMRDAFRGEFDVAVVVSNDTDLVEPMRIVTKECGKPVGLICPAPAAARSLSEVASFCRFISKARLAASQFPDQIPGTSIRKPDLWTIDGRRR